MDVLAGIIDNVDSTCDEDAC